MRLIDADELANDLEHDVELCARALDDMNMVGKEREDMQFQKDCKQNCIWYISEQPTVDRWIPVSERLPAWGEIVLICNQRGEFALGRITQSDEGNVWDVGAWWIELKEYDAWMPLPDPYRGEK